jgi:hypothetical protein
LILKERLSRISAGLVYKGGTAAPGAKTVDAMEALGLLRRNGVAIAKNDGSAIDKLRRLRHDIEHAEFDLDPDAARSVVAAVTSFLFHFWRDELGLDLLAKVNPSAAQSIKTLDQIAATLREEYMQQWREDAVEWDPDWVEFLAADPDSGGFEDYPCEYCGRPGHLVAPDRVVCTECGEQSFVDKCFCGSPVAPDDTVCAYHRNQFDKDDLTRRQLNRLDFESVPATGAIVG